MLADARISKRLPEGPGGGVAVGPFELGRIGRRVAAFIHTPKNLPFSTSFSREPEGSVPA